MLRRTPQPEAALVLNRSLALILAWSLLLPAAPARPSLVAVPKPAIPLVSAIPSPITSDPRPAPTAPDPQSDGTTFKCPPLPNDPDNFLSRDSNSPLHPHKPGDEWGEITVAQPKIWQFDRVSSLLDGLLRDVEGVSLSDLIQLNPNSQNAAAVRFVQSALEVGVQYDQAAAVNARNTLSTFQAQQGSQLQQLDAYNTYLQTLTTQRNNLASQLAAATNQVNTLQALQAAGTATPAQAAELLAAQASVQSLTSSLTATNSLISGAGAPPTLTAPPTLVGTSVTGPASGSNMSSSLNGFSQVLSSLPQGVQNNLSNALGSPTLPATKQLDNFITLLYERLAREVSVLQDDLMRDPENEAFLLQFDVGLYPSKRSSDHVARVEFNLQCPGCRIYSLYPGMSAYNIASYTGSSKRTTLWGNVLTLLGFGLSASYRRQVDTLQGGLVQSVYTAGFQNGVLNTPDDKYSPEETAGFATQSFGWYYGQAPTEKLVTPGMRTTFAMLTVPRNLIEKNEDRFGNVNTCLGFKINGAWARRDNPTLQHSYVSALGDVAKVLSFPAYYPANNPLYNHDDEKSYVYKRASVKLPASADDVPLVARREHQKLHVIRMEYNTVYAPPPPPSSAPPPTSTTTSVSSSSTTTPAAPSTSTSTATSGTTTTTTTTTTTGAAPAATSTPPPAPAAPSYPNLNPLPCPPHECSAILVRLDRPIDPNLVVTVRGQPLQRVRDWRGRATSILPAAQSGSDLSAAASGSGSISLKQLQAGRSLLESDQFEPNSWFQLNARDLIMNVSKSVATDWEFPFIQISSPGGTFAIPVDVQRNTTELIVNGFRFKTETDLSIRQAVLRNYGADLADGLNKEHEYKPRNSPLWAGFYPLSTFLPLFSGDPRRQKFYAQVGQTGEDILVGFLPDHESPCSTASTHCLAFLESHVQVILEDRELGFAWSLDCYLQGYELACHLPRAEMAGAYISYLRACTGNSDACVALRVKYKPLIESLKKSQLVANATQVPAGKTPDPQQKSTELMLLSNSFIHGGDGLFAPPQQNQTIPRSKKNKNAPKISSQSPAGEDAKNKIKCFDPEDKDKLLHASDITGFQDAFVTSMQLWVEQADPEGDQNFYTAEPTKIDFLPLSDDFWQPNERTNVLCPNIPRERQFLPTGPQVWKSLSHPSHMPDSAPEPKPDMPGLPIKPVAASAGSLAAIPDQPAPAPVPGIAGRFYPWHFKSATFSAVTIEGCNYFPPHTMSPDSMKFTLLGPTNPPDLKPQLIQGDNPNNCETLQLGTSELTRSQLVFEAQFKNTANSSEQPIEKPDGTSDEKPEDVTAILHLSTSRLKPAFSRPHVNADYYNQPSVAGNEGSQNTKLSNVLAPYQWEVFIPVVRVAPGDTLDLPNDLKMANFKSRWRKDGVDTDDVPQVLDQDEDGISIHLTIPIAALRYLPSQFKLLRDPHDGHGPIPIASLPDVRKLILPSKLKLMTISDHQFALQGENAGRIDAVSVSSGGDKSQFKQVASSGTEFALATFDAAADKSSSNGSGNGATDDEGSSNITVLDSTASSKITITKQNKSTTTTKPSSTPSTTQPAGGNQGGSVKAPPSPSDSLSAAPKSQPLDPGSYLVQVFIVVDYTVDTAKLGKAATDLKTAQDKLSSAKAALQKTKTPADKAARQKDVDAVQEGLKKAEANKTEADKPSVPTYMPIPVTDDKGGPLIFVVPEAKKPATPPATPPPTCTAPCAIPLCTTSGCPPAPKPATTPSS